MPKYKLYQMIEGYMQSIWVTRDFLQALQNAKEIHGITGDMTVIKDIYGEVYFSMRNNESEYGTMFEVKYNEDIEALVVTNLLTQEELFQVPKPALVGQDFYSGLDTRDYTNKQLRDYIYQYCSDTLQDFLEPAHTTTKQ